LVPRLQRDARRASAQRRQRWLIVRLALRKDEHRSTAAQHVMQRLERLHVSLRIERTGKLSGLYVAHAHEWYDTTARQQPRRNRILEQRRFRGEHDATWNNPGDEERVD